MLGRKQKQVLKVYGDHLVNQEAEIKELQSIVADYKQKFGDIGLGDSVASQKADLEKQVQEKRQQNQELSLELNTKEDQLIQYQSSLKQLDEALQTLTSDNASKELQTIQTEIANLETKHNEVDNLLREKEDQISRLLSTKKF